MYGGNGHFQYSKGNNSKSRKTRVTVCVLHMKLCKAVLNLQRGHENC